MKYFNSSNNLYKYLVPNVGTIVIVALMLLGYSVYAAPSAQTTVSTFPYQGTLTDASGNPVTDNVDMTFRIFDVSTGGTALWTETHTGANAVPVENGLFQLMLGSLVPIPESVWGNSALYLEVQVGSDTPMSPRELIGTVPRSIQADIATNALSADHATRASIADTVPNGSITSDKMENHLCCGSTNTNGIGWQRYSDTAIFIHVDTSSCNFSSTPMYFTSLGGANTHYTTVGATSIYAPSATKFDIYLSSRDAGTTTYTASLADEKNFYIQWCGVEK